MKKLLLFICLFFVGSVYAANQTYYVATPADGGNDGNAGNSGAPFATLQKAVDMVNNVAGDHTVYVKTGSYTPAAHLNFQYTDLAYSSISFIGTDSSWTEAATAALGPLFTPSDAAKYAHLDNGAIHRQIAFKKFRLTSTASSSMFFCEGDDNEGDNGVDLQYCDIVCPNGIIRYDTSTNFTNATRTIRLSYCNVNYSTYAGWILKLGSFASLTIDHDAFTGNGNTLGLIYIEGDSPNVGAMTINDNTGDTGGYFLNVTDSGLNYGLPSVDINRNTITCRSHWVGVNYKALGSSPTFKIMDNDVTVIFGGVSADILTIGDGEGPSTNYGDVQVLRNTFRFQGCTGGVNHGLALMVGVVRGEAAYNQIYNDGGDGTYSMVIKGSGLSIHHNISRGLFGIVVAAGTKNHINHNTTYCDVAGGKAFRMSRNIDDTTFPEYNIITDNIFHGGVGGASGYAENVEHYTTGATDTIGYKANILDRNILYKGNCTYLASINGANQTALSDLQAAWVTYGNSNNDVNSYETDPLYINIAGNDFRTPPTSPMFMSGYFNEMKGAFQKSGGSSGRFRR